VKKIDAHQHFWDPGRFNYPWMKPDMKVLRRAFLPQDLKGLIEEVGVRGTVLIQTISSIEETRWFLEMADANQFIAGVVGWVDLRAPDISDVLDEFTSHPKFKGVRHQVEDEPDQAWLIREDVLRGLGELARRNIPYDLLVKTAHLKYVPVIAHRHPSLRMVIDHIAKPPIAKGEIEEWAKALAPVAKIPNIWCKLSGMITEADWKRWKPLDIKPYADYVIEKFGFERVMFGSDWPVCLLAGSYRQVFDTVQELVRYASPEEKSRLFAANAIEFYNLSCA